MIKKFRDFLLYNSVKPLLSKNQVDFHSHTYDLRINTKRHSEIVGVDDKCIVDCCYDWIARSASETSQERKAVSTQKRGFVEREELEVVDY